MKKDLDARACVTARQWVGLLAVFLALGAVSADQSPSCGLGALVPEQVVCAAVQDCLGLPHPACTGTWSCTMGVCAWLCGVVAENDASDDGAIGDAVDTGTPADSGSLDHEGQELPSKQCTCPAWCLKPVPGSNGTCACVHTCPPIDSCTIGVCSLAQNACVPVDIDSPDCKPTQTCRQCQESATVLNLCTGSSFSECLPRQCGPDETGIIYSCMLDAHCPQYHYPALGFKPHPSDDFCQNGALCPTSEEQPFCIQFKVTPETGLISTMKNCDDGDPATNDWCDKYKLPDNCVNYPIATECYDSNPCTFDMKSLGVCQNPPIDCDDNDACTADACDMFSGECVHAKVQCPDDNNACTYDICSPRVGCRHVPGNNWKYLLNVCSHSYCDPESGDWLNEPIPSKCVDYNFCTEDFADPAGNCVHVPYSCDDGNACTIDSCISGLCRYKLAPGC